MVSMSEEIYKQLNNLLTRCGVGFSKEDIEAITLLMQENQQLKEQKNKALNYIKNYNSMEFRHQDKKVMDRLDIIKRILNNRLNFEVEDIEIIKLKKQLKQRDEVIDEAIEFIKEETDSMSAGLGIKKSINTYKLLDILQKYKGDNK